MSSASPVPEWPSLYNFFIEVDDFEHRNPVQAKGFYLENANGMSTLASHTWLTQL